MQHFLLDLKRNMDLYTKIKITRQCFHNDTNLMAQYFFTIYHCMHCIIINKLYYSNTRKSYIILLSNALCHGMAGIMFSVGRIQHLIIIIIIIHIISCDPNTPHNSSAHMCIVLSSRDAPKTRLGGIGNSASRTIRMCIIML